MRYFLLIFLFGMNCLAQTTLDSPQNWIINGAFDSFQAGETRGPFVSTGSAITSVVSDLFSINLYSTDEVDPAFARETSIVPAGFYNALKYSIPANVESTLAANEAVTIGTYIEGLNIRELLGKYVTFAFWVRSNTTGVFATVFKNSNVNRTMVKEYTINAADTWEEKFVSFYFDPTGTWLIDTNIGLRIDFTLACGTDFDDATEGTWAASNEFCTAASQGTDLTNSTSDNFYITGVRLYAGTQRRPFVRAGLTMDAEMLKIYRYQWKWKTERNLTAGTSIASRASGYATNYVLFNFPLPVPMRTNPTCTIGHVAGVSWDVYTVAGVAQSFTGQTDRVSDDRFTGQVQADKTSHGLTDAKLFMKTTSGFVECSATW